MASRNYPVTVPRWISALLLAVAVTASAAWWLQSQAAAELRAEITWLRDEARELASIRAENIRLAATQPVAAELTALRADHAAVARLQREIDALRETVRNRERALGSNQR